MSLQLPHLRPGTTAPVSAGHPVQEHPPALLFTRATKFPGHRIIEWFGFEGTLKIIWFQPPCHEQGHLPLDQVAQSSIQLGLEHCQGWGR